MVKYSLLGSTTLQKIDYLDKKRHGTAEFPIEYYYVNSNHPRYQMAFHWHNEWEIVRILDGSMQFYLDDAQYAKIYKAYLKQARREGLYKADKSASFKRAEYNPGATSLLKSMSEHEKHHLLHVSYVKK